MADKILNENELNNVNGGGKDGLAPDIIIFDEAANDSMVFPQGSINTNSTESDGFYKVPLD